eukprot:Skav201720  [mRNA]  locus=scaffold311:509192:521642:- [translate_table: standard]
MGCDGVRAGSWCLDNGIEWGYSAMQGWRERMEDAHLAIGSLPSTSSRWRETSLFAVMDGHGGEQVAQFCRRHLPSELGFSRVQDVAWAAAGGAVLQQHVGNHVHYRINGNLNLSRSIGDLLCAGR